ncbi:SGNH/GDSL hydrolase family protein [Shimia sp. MIT910701]|uniref:SGNH/GDSL hydrolase family protein n=1 Tax=Shimia sp. MIT910701 TaxID=3096987 RepID=UPI00399C09C5
MSDFPHGGAKEVWRHGSDVSKGAASDWGQEVESRVAGVEASLAAGVIWTRNTLAELNAIAAAGQGDVGRVLDDGALSGTYEHDGTEFVRVADLPPQQTAESLGLENVDNTADLDKPISNAQKPLFEAFGQATAAEDTDDPVRPFSFVGGDPGKDHGGFDTDGLMAVPGLRLVPLLPPDDDFDQAYVWLDAAGKVVLQIDHNGQLFAEPSADMIAKFTCGKGLAARDMPQDLLPGNVWGGAGHTGDLNRHFSDVSGVARAYLSRRNAPTVAVEEGRAPANYIMGQGDSISNGSGGTDLRSATALTPVTGFMMASGVRGGGNTVFVAASATSLVPAIEAVDGNLGSTGLTTAMQLLDRYQNEDGGDRTVWIARNSGQSGERLDQIQQGDVQFENAIAELAHAVTLLDVYERDVICDTVVLNCGTNDRSAAITAASYASDLRQLLDDKNARIKAVTGQTKDVHLFQWQIAAPQYGEGEASEISRAQMDMGEAHADIHTVGASYWVTLNDNVHPNALGHDLKGEYVAKAIRNWKRYGDTRHAPTPQVSNITVAGSVITVPVLTVPRHDGGGDFWPLQFRADNVAQAPNQGFALTDSGGAAIQSVVISDAGAGGTATVTITLDQPPAAGAVLEYAYTGAGAEQDHSQAYGNLWDTDTTASLTAPGYILHNAALSFQEVIS